jgi:hypothetical protein
MAVGIWQVGDTRLGESIGSGISCWVLERGGAPESGKGSGVGVVGCWLLVVGDQGSCQVKGRFVHRVQ